MLTNFRWAGVFLPWLSIICFGDKLFGIQSFDFLLILSHIWVHICLSFCSYAHICAFEGLRSILGIFLTHALCVVFFVCLLVCFVFFGCMFSHLTWRSLSQLDWLDQQSLEFFCLFVCHRITGARPCLVFYMNAQYMNPGVMYLCALLTGFWQELQVLLTHWDVSSLPDILIANT